MKEGKSHSNNTLVFYFLGLKIEQPSVYTFVLIPE